MATVRRSIVAGCLLAVLLAAPAAATPRAATIRAHASVGWIDLGQTTSIVGNVSPATATPRVVVQVNIKGLWHDRQGAVVKPDGSFSIGIRPSRQGAYNLRVRSNGRTVASNVVQVLVFPPPPKVILSTGYDGSPPHALSFTVPNDWSINYRFNCASDTGGNFIADLYLQDTYVGNIANDLAVNGGRTLHLHDAPGSYQITVETEDYCNWGIEITTP